MNQPLVAVNAHATLAIMSRIINKPIHKQTMRSQKITLRVRLPFRYLFISSKSVAYLLNFTRQPHNRFAIKNISHLLNAQGIIFNSKRSLNSTDAIIASQLRCQSTVIRIAPTGYKFNDISHLLHNLRCDSIGWLITHAAVSSMSASASGMRN